MNAKPSLETQRTESLAELRAQRDAAAVDRALDTLEQAARSETNLMPAIITAVEAYATLGEIADRLRTVFGTYQETFTL